MPSESGASVTIETVQRAPNDGTLRVSERLTIPMLELAEAPVTVSLDHETRRRVSRCRSFLEARIVAGDEIYGSTTGFGPLVTFAGRSDGSAQCDNAINHLIAGQGSYLPPTVTRAAILSRLWTLARGYSGVSVGTVEALVAMLATQFAPEAPEVGSVGASGDLIPLAHMVRSLKGDGYAHIAGQRLPAAEALAIAGLKPLALDGRDALALVNGTPVTAAAAGLAVASAQRSHRIAAVLSAVLIDILGSDPVFLSSELLAAFGHPAAETTAALMRKLLVGTVPTGTRQLQEPYSLRCTPQLLGAAATSIAHVRGVVEGDLNGISDNPLFFADQEVIVHGGNFFGQPVSFAADALSTSLIQMGNLAERQLDLLIDPHRNTDLHPMLSASPGAQHGVQGVQLAATSIIAQMRRSGLAASIQSLPTNGHNQDIVPFGTQAALNALDLAHSLRWLHGSLAVALRQAAYLSGARPTAPACTEVIRQLGEVVPPIDPDRPLDADVRAAADVLDRLASQLTAQP